MELITHYGIRTDRHLTPLEALWLRINVTPYRHLAQTDKQHLVAVLADEHTRRESVRFAPITRRQPHNEEDVK